MIDNTILAGGGAAEDNVVVESIAELYLDVEVVSHAFPFNDGSTLSMPAVVIRLNSPVENGKTGMLSFSVHITGKSGTGATDVVYYGPISGKAYNYNEYSTGTGVYDVVDNSLYIVTDFSGVKSADYVVAYRKA